MRHARAVGQTERDHDSFARRKGSGRTGADTAITRCSINPVKIAFDGIDLDPRLRAGMSATVSIRTGR